MFGGANNRLTVEFEVLTAVTMESTIFWVLMPCSLETAQRFGRTTAYIFRVEG
jgi:hypothetical protein